MFAVKNKSTGKFLKAFNGSWNKASFGVHCDIAEEMLGGKKKGIDNTSAVVDKLRDVPWEKVIERMWCLDTPDGAQLYKKESTVFASVNTIDQDWFEIVPVVSAEKKPDDDPNVWLNLRLSKEQLKTLQHFLGLSDLVYQSGGDGDSKEAKILFGLRNEIEAKTGVNGND